MVDATVEVRAGGVTYRVPVSVDTLAELPALAAHIKATIEGKSETIVQE